MIIARYSRTQLLIAAGIGAALGFGVSALMLNPSESREPSLHEPAAMQQAASSPGQEPAVQAVDIEQVRKDLSTRFIGDPRTLGEKLRDFIAENSTPQTIPIACKVIADLAENADAISNQELDTLYHTQTHTDVKRVIAQVLSLRGDNTLLDKYIADFETGLRSENPTKRRQALQELAKTHYAGAADALLPLLEDMETDVRLDALLALRATGNERHTPYAEKLRSDPDPSVNWLANDALNSLQYLSTKARTRLISADIAAELPSLAPGS